MKEDEGMESFADLDGLRYASGHTPTAEIRVEMQLAMQGPEFKKERSASKHKK
jgi:hypothetical protein